jgi:ribose 5-phosphate isomerase B
MKIHIGSDHAGLELKSALVQYLESKGHKVTDHGPHEYDALDDYPDFCIPAAVATVKDAGSLGIVLGGSGNGEQIAANKVKGVRAALAWSVETAKLAFIETPFTNDERHVRRINKISTYENTSNQ